MSTLSHPLQNSARDDSHNSARDTRRVAFATIVGTTIEWYDFFIYANAAGLVFAKLFFEPAGNDIAPVGFAFVIVGLELPRSGRWAHSWPDTSATGWGAGPCWSSP